MSTDEEIQATLAARHREQAERLRLYRFERFLSAGFDFTEADLLERAGADYHVAEQLAQASCPHEQALRILL